MTQFFGAPFFWTGFQVRTTDFMTILDDSVTSETRHWSSQETTNTIATQSGHGFYQSPADSAIHADAQTFLSGVQQALEVVKPYSVEDERLPFGVTQPYWDDVNSLVEHDQEQGEWSIRVQFTAEAAQVDKYLNICFNIPTGDCIGEVNVRLVKAVGVPQPISAVIPFFGSSSSFTNGIEVLITSVGTNVDAYNQSVYVSKTGGEIV